jgi:hypothetical protein
MKILSWNTRGLGRLGKRKEVCKLVGEKHPAIVYLQETKCNFATIFLCMLFGVPRTTRAPVFLHWGYREVF